MSFLQILALAVALAMDATAVAAARGCAVERAQVGDVLRIALAFGGAQAAMPVLGWALGAQLGAAVAHVDHWIAFFVLAGLGVKMLRDARSPREALAFSGPEWRVLLALAFATSLDAFAVGMTLPLLRAPFALAVATIGLVTAVLSGLGVVAGRRFGARFGRRLDAYGGLALILLGCKLLIEHLAIF